MKTIIRWFFRLAVTLVILVILLAVVAVLLKDVIAKSLTEKALRDGTGMDAQIARMEVGLATPTVSLEGLKLYNTTNFGPDVFLELPELRMEYVFSEVMQGKLHMKVVRLSIAELNIVKDKNGRTNLEMMQKAAKDKEKAPTPKKSHGPGVEFGGIDTFYLSVGQLKITDLANPAHNQVIIVALKDEVGRNLKTETEVAGWFAGVVFKLYFQEMAKNPESPGLRSLLDGGRKPKRIR